MSPRIIAASVIAVALAAGAAAAQEVAGIPVTDEPRNVRHAAAVPGDPIVTLRYFRVRKGATDEFIAVSQAGVWPFFEKIGARVLGMFPVIHPEDVGETATPESPAYDEIWLITRYASVDHWSATRRMAELGGNGADYRAALEALHRRRELTLETNLRFLAGEPWPSPPHFLPALEEGG